VKNTIVFTERLWWWKKKKKKVKKENTSPIRLDSNLRTIKNRQKIRHLVKESQQRQKDDAFESAQFKDKFGDWSSDESSTSSEDLDTKENKKLKQLLTGKKVSSGKEDSSLKAVVNLDDYDQYITRFSHLLSHKKKQKPNKKPEKSKKN